MQTRTAVFISYASEDREVARVYARLIKRKLPLRFRPFLDVECIEAGDEWSESIRSALEDCGVCIALFSERYLDRVSRDPDKYRSELEQAIQELYEERKKIEQGDLNKEEEDSSESVDACSQLEDLELKVNTPREWTRYESFVAHFLGKLVPFVVPTTDPDKNKMRENDEIEASIVEIKNNLPDLLKNVQFGVSQVRLSRLKNGNLQRVLVNKRKLQKDIDQIARRAVSHYELVEKRDALVKDRERRQRRNRLIAGVTLGVLGGAGVSGIWNRSVPVDDSPMTAQLDRISDQFSIMTLLQLSRGGEDVFLGDMKKWEYDAIMSSSLSRGLVSEYVGCEEYPASWGEFSANNQELFEIMDNFEYNTVKLRDNDTLTKLASRSYLSVESYRFIIFANRKYYLDEGYHPSCVLAEWKELRIPEIPFARKAGLQSSSG